MQVALGVVPCNETKNEELLEILHEMMKYAPQIGDSIFKICILAGDQLTTERSRNLQMIRATSNTPKDRFGRTPSYPCRLAC